MTQTIGKVRVVTSSQPIANAQLNAVKVSVNPGNTQRVKSLNYFPEPSDFLVSEAGDVLIENTANNASVLTYDSVSQTFKVQNIPRLNGGTF